MILRLLFCLLWALCGYGVSHLVPQDPGACWAYPILFGAVAVLIVFGFPAATREEF